MFVHDETYIRVIIFVLGACGFWVARHIHHHKKPDNKPLVCPMKFDCNAVVHSDYSKFAGIPLEVLGMFYYGLVTIFYLYMVFLPVVMPTAFIATAVALSISAFLFSLYLIFVQVFILKKGCFWCFISAGISVLIFISTVYAYDFSSIVINLI